MILMFVAPFVWIAWMSIVVRREIVSSRQQSTRVLTALRKYSETE